MNGTACFILKTNGVAMSNYSNSKFQEDENTSWFKVKNIIKPGSTVLDIGCSSGNFGKVLIDQKGCVVDGIELDKGDYEIAKNNLRYVYNMNIENDNIDVFSEKYKYIYFGDVIEHLVYPVRTLKKVKSLLAEDGGVLFSIPNMAYISVRLDLLRGGFDYGETGLLDKTHLHFYDLNEVHRVFEDAGYSIKILDYVERDLPSETLKYELNDIGLKANDKFLKSAKGLEASAYQFVGLAIPVFKYIKSKPRIELSPQINEMEKHFHYLDSVHKEQIKAHKKRIKELENNNKSLEEHIKILENKGFIDRVLGK